MQCGAPFFKSRPASFDRLPILLHDVANRGWISDRDSRKDVVTAAACDEQRYDVAPMFAARTKNCGPSDDIERVIVSNAVNVCSGVEQGAHDLDMTVSRRPMQRIRVVAGLERV